jgi:hypothetical protein
LASYKDYKNRRRNVTSVINKLKEKNEKKGFDKDERFFEWTPDENKNANVRMRFLPSKSDLPPIISRYRHGFQYNGKWYIANCPTTIKKKCKACMLNSAICDSSSTGKEECQGRFRRKEYIANVYIIKDENNPANDGTVKLYKFGQSIYDMIAEQLQGDGDEPVDIFDFEEGCNFTLKVRRKKGYANYDKSQFSDPAPLEGGDELYEKIFEQIHELDEFLADKEFPSEEWQEKRLNHVFGAAYLNKYLGTVGKNTDDSEDEDDGITNTPSKADSVDTSEDVSDDSEDEDDVADDDLNEFFNS